MTTRSTRLALVCLAAILAVLPQPSLGQCFAGYANVAVMQGYNFAVNPLDYPPNRLDQILNSCTNCGIGDGTKVYVWDVTNQLFLPPATFSTASGTWDRNFDLPPGKGFVIYATVAWTNTFVGYICGCYTNHTFVAGSNKLSFLGSKVPASVTLSGPYPYSSANYDGPYNHQFQGSDGDSVTLFNYGSQSYSEVVRFFTGYGWYDPGGAADTNGPVLGMGQAFFVQHPGPDYDWTEALPCQLASVSGSAPPPSSSPAFRNISIRANKVTLQVAEAGARYDVQFSPNAASWTTISTRHQGPVWTGTRPATPQGYFRVIPSSSTKGAQ